MFMPDSDGKRPVNGSSEKFQNDPYWKDTILFHEYFHGDNGKGLGASHQTGWTGCIVRIIQLMSRITKDMAQNNDIWQGPINNI